MQTKIVVQIAGVDDDTLDDLMFTFSALISHDLGVPEDEVVGQHALEATPKYTVLLPPSGDFSQDEASALQTRLTEAFKLKQGELFVALPATA